MGIRRGDGGTVRARLGRVACGGHVKRHGGMVARRREGMRRRVFAQLYRGPVQAYSSRIRDTWYSELV